jgi:hypothetical protein|uniref:Uncharacterized protein n=1 Tax=Phage sp. ctgh419 TaxID=2828009 RepID=A0A8S5SM25_9VIRU|nr:MAG TPA: hypothetical protein [Phage sp. ctgh419]DAS98460.1 MAG TPA: hypothetical protein [Caudoviricetes sp.]
MKYQNTVTGAVVESASPIQGKYWIEIEEIKESKKEKPKNGEKQ